MDVDTSMKRELVRKTLRYQHWFSTTQEIERSIFEALNQLCGSEISVEESTSKHGYIRNIRCKDFSLVFKLAASSIYLSRAFNTIPIVDATFNFEGPIELFHQFRMLYMLKTFRAGG